MEVCRQGTCGDGGAQLDRSGVGHQWFPDDELRGMCTTRQVFNMEYDIYAHVNIINKGSVALLAAKFSCVDRIIGVEPLS